MNYFGELASEFATMVIKGAVGYATSEPKVIEAVNVLKTAEEQDGWVAAKDFLDAYDVRIYNLENDQYDIKIMKKNDFEGGYVLWNKTKDVYHTGIGSTVYKKVERNFRGYGNAHVFADSESGDEFLVTLYRLESTEYDDLHSLGTALKEAYGTYPTLVSWQANDSGEQQSSQFSIPWLIYSLFILGLICFLFK